MNRMEVYKIIDEEREYQDSRWNAHTTPSGGQHSPAEWLVYMQDYLTEAIHFAAREADPVSSFHVMGNIRKITAMGVAAMEQCVTPRRIV